MLTILKLLKKNFKLLWKSKLFVLTILIAPLVMAILLGLAFNNTDIYSIDIGIYTSKYDEFKNQIVYKLSENFNVLKFNHEDSCLRAIKDYTVHVCIVLPEAITLNNNEISEIIFYVDNTRVNLVWMILDSLSNILERSSSEMSMDLTNDLLLKLENAEVKTSSLGNLTTKITQNSGSSLGYLNQINLDLDSVDLGKTQDRLENSMSKNRQLELELNSLIRNINKKSDEGKAKLSSINTNNSLDSVKKKFKEIGDLVSRTNTGAYASEVNSLLNELDEDVFKIKETFSAVSNKNAEAEILLAETLGYIEQAQGIIKEINDEIGNLSVTNASKIVNPIVTEIRPISSETTYFSFIYPTLIVLIIVFTSILLSSSIIIIERKSRAFFRNYTSSTSDMMFFIAYFATGLMIVFGDVFIFVIFAKIFFKAPLSFPFFFILILIVSLFILLGSLIGYIVQSEQSSILTGLTISSFLVFFSNTIIPIESASRTLREIIQYNPFVISEVILRKLLIYKLPLEFLWNDLFLLLIYILILILILFLFLKFVYGNKINFFRLRKERRKNKKNKKSGII